MLTEVMARAAGTDADRLGFARKLAVSSMNAIKADDPCLGKVAGIYLSDLGAAIAILEAAGVVQ